MPGTLEQKRSIRELRELYRDLHRFGEDLRETGVRFQEMVRFGGFTEHGRSFHYERTDPGDTLNRSIDITREFEFLVAVTGAFSSGKSTLLNLLLEHEELLPASVIPMTAVCTAIRYGDPRVDVRYVSFEECFRRAQILIDRPFKKNFGPEELNEGLECPDHFLDDPTAQASLQRFARILCDYDRIVRERLSFSERAPYISGGGVLPGRDGRLEYLSPTPHQEEEYKQRGGDPRRWVNKEWLALIRDVNLWVPSRLLENSIVLLDLPGLNCREDYHRRAIQDYCNMADCILVTAFQPGNQADEEVIANFKSLSNNYNEKIFFVFNKVDQFTNEPRELSRAVDYLARDTIGGDFPAERFFLTSAQLARSSRAGDESATTDLERLSTALTGISASLPGLEGWVANLVSPKDPGGVHHLRTRLNSFLMNDAYRTKISEIVSNYRLVLDQLRDAASPSFEETLNMDATDILRNSLLEYFRQVEKLQRNALYKFRFDYLRGHEANGRAVLREDLKVMLDRVHDGVQKKIIQHFNRPILSAPLREDPVSEFDLLRIADDSSQILRRELQELIIKAVHGRVCEVFNGYLEKVEFKKHLQNIFRGAPEWIRRMENVFEDFQETLLHSLKCIVRNGFFHMPRGRDLKRLEQRVPLPRLKDTLVQVFGEFYPAWIYENIYSEVLDRLWLSLFLDTEDLEDDMAEFFKSTEAVITGTHIAEQVEIPEKLADGTRDLYRTVRMCQRIENLLAEREALESRALSLGVLSS